MLLCFNLTTMLVLQMLRFVILSESSLKVSTTLVTLNNTLIEVTARRSAMVGTSVHLWWPGWLLQRGEGWVFNVLTLTDCLAVLRSPPTMRRAASVPVLSRADSSSVSFASSF